MKRVWVTDTKKLSHRQKGLVNNQGRSMHSFVNKLRLEVNLSMIGSWTQLWENISSLRTTQDSQFRGWLGIELNFDKLATQWQLLKTQEMSMIGTRTQCWEISNSLITTQDSRNVDEWNLNLVMRHQQLIEHYSTLKTCWWLRLEIIFERSATHWSPLKTQENVDGWNLDSPLRHQQLLDDTASVWAPLYRL